MATWIAPKTFADGDYLSFAELNAACGANGDIQWLKDALEQIGVTASTGTQSVSGGLIGFRAFGGEQQIPSSVWTRVVWSEQRFGKRAGGDVQYVQSAQPERLHLPYVPSNLRMNGTWALGAHVAFAANTTGDRGVRIVIRNANQSDVLAQQIETAPGLSTEMAMTITTVHGEPTNGGTYLLQGGDDLAVEVYQTSGDKLTLTVAPAFSPEFWGVRVATTDPFL
ncbi:MAG TPA: hypothetical protein VFJ93_07675 [Gaiellaceae bacterium]|nr:hypothetical protein [Gaiellaceae bacterium]